MATQPTNLPVPSESPRDLKFNAGKIDEFVTSRELKYIDRFGGEHYTIEGISKLSKEAISSFGYITMDSFEDGNTLTLPNQVLRLEATGEYYRWDGAFPKVVPAASTPESTGGIGAGKWLSVGDATLRGELADVNSDISIAGVPASQVGGNATNTKYLEAPDVYDVVVAYGQSNALGCAGLSGDTTGFPAPSSKSLMFDPIDGTIKPIIQNMVSTSGDISTGHAWCAFANEWYRLSGRGTVVINSSKGSQPLVNLMKGSSSGLYTLMQDGVKKLKDRMAVQGLNLGNLYVVFHQGETDQQLGTGFDTYSFNLTTLIDSLATDLGMKRFGNCTVGCPTNRPEQSWSTIQNSQRYTVNRRINAVTVFDGCPSFLLGDGNVGSEGIHYTQIGYNTMGCGAARGLWSIENGSSRTKSDPDFADYSHDVVPWSRAKQCYASAQFSNSSNSWVVLNKDNGDTLLRPANISDVTVASDGNSLLFSLADNARTWFGFNGGISRNAEMIGLYVSVDRANVAAKFNLRVSIYIDLDLIINVSTGAVTSPRSGTSSSWLSSLVSVSVSAGTAVVTHGSTLNIAQVSHYAGSSLADTGATVSVNCPSNTQTRVYLANATSNPTVVLSLRGVLVTPEKLQTLGATQVFVSGVYAPNL